MADKEAMQPSQEKPGTKYAVLGCTILVAAAASILFLLFTWNEDRQSSPAPTVASVAVLASATVAESDAVSTLPPATAIATQGGLPVPSVTSKDVGLTPTVAATAQPLEHEIVAGDTLFDIALLYNVTVEELAAANNISEPSQIFIGQILVVPGTHMADTVAPSPEPPPVPDGQTGVVPSTSTTIPLTVPAEANGPAAPNWPPSQISGDLEGNYPLVQDSDSGALRLHYQPGTFPDQNFDWLAPALDTIWSDLNAELGGRIDRQVDIFLAGTLFAVNPALQGYTQSGLYRSFVLANGAFERGETEYILAHELAHIVATYAFGPPSSPMIHEGLALYLPQSHLVDGSGYLSHETICALAKQTPAFKPATELAQLGYGANGFGGHIRTFVNYNLSGCFVDFLVETYGIDRLNQVYDTGNYITVYGRSLDQLDSEWQAALSAVPVPVDPAQFIGLVNETAQAYDAYVGASSGGFHADYDAYLILNRARLAANRGELEQARTLLDSFWSEMDD